MQQDRLGTALDDLFDVLLLQDGLAVDDDVVTPILISHVSLAARSHFPH